MEPVNGVSLMSFVGVDMNDLTFFWVELHLPRPFPFLQSKILLDWFCISITFDECTAGSRQQRGEDRRL